jgi:hypothetical protein
MEPKHSSEQNHCLTTLKRTNVASFLLRRITALPSNDVLELIYVDPATGKNETCSSFCGLLSNSSVPYQDFLFSESTQLTGVQVTLTEWTGLSAGLHILQLLSDGMFF